jgi:hypothetical protein
MLVADHAGFFDQGQAMRSILGCSRVTHLEFECCRSSASEMLEITVSMNILAQRKSQNLDGTPSDRESAVPDARNIALSQSVRNDGEPHRNISELTGLSCDWI